MQTLKLSSILLFITMISGCTLSPPHQALHSSDITTLIKQAAEKNHLLVTRQLPPISNDVINALLPTITATPQNKQKPLLYFDLSVKKLPATDLFNVLR